MTCRDDRLFPALTAMYALATCLSAPAPLPAKTHHGALVSAKFTPQLTARIYSFPGLSPWILRNAEAEATHAMRDVALTLVWMDCTAKVLSGVCLAPPAPGDLIVRILKKALPQASGAALGINDSSDSSAAAFVFYDRVFALRSYTLSVPVMLGRVIAHEITHLLLPREPHSNGGLMKAQWTAEDLQPQRSAGLGLARESLEFLEIEALRRERMAR